MAILIINSEDYSEKLQDFELTCKSCGSRKITLDLDWAAYPSAQWCRLITSCGECHRDEEIYEVS